MITAVDTNIILDVLIPGEPFGESSKLLLDRHLSKGKLIVGEVVYSRSGSMSWVIFSSAPTPSSTPTASSPATWGYLKHISAT